MARIRTIKPEFWTDETMVRLPFEARLLYIGLWNFADDHGCFEDEPERIRLQVLPADTDIDAASLLDLLHAAGRLEKFEEPGGRRFWRIPHFSEHQKIDKPSKPKFAASGECKKLAIPAAVRRAVAEKYGCAPGERKQVTCFYCGEPGEITWWKLRSGRPSAFVSFGLELDHFVAESSGGKASVENIVLACRSCNRRKLDLDGLGFITEKVHPLANAREGSPNAREGSPLEGKGREGKGEEGRETAAGAAPPAQEPILPDCQAQEREEALRELWNTEAAPELPRWREMPRARRAAARARLRERPLPEWREIIRRISASSFCRGANDRGWRADPDWLLRPGTAAKVLEGKYDDAPPRERHRHPAPAGPPEPTFVEFDGSVDLYGGVADHG